MNTNDWPAQIEPKALLIGHYPRLQKSDTSADYALFADYHFRNEIPTSPAEKRK
jgi:hypothetical protein